MQSLNLSAFEGIVYAAAGYNLSFMLDQNKKEFLASMIIEVTSTESSGSDCKTEKRMVIDNIEVTNGKELEDICRKIYEIGKINRFGIVLCSSDIEIFLSREWFNDNNISCYFNLLQSKYENELYVFNPFMYKFLESRKMDLVYEWYKDINVYKFRYVYIPINITSHWIFICVNVRAYQLEYYDSLSGRNSKVISLIQAFLKKLFKKEKDFHILPRRTIPQQSNGYDCGLFVCLYAKMRLFNWKITFDPSNNRTHRLQLLHEIYAEQILYLHSYNK